MSWAAVPSSRRNAPACRPGLPSPTSVLPREAPRPRRPEPVRGSSYAEVEEIVVLDRRLRGFIPAVAQTLIAVRLVDERRLVRKALAAGIDAVTDQAGALTDAVGV